MRQVPGRRCRIRTITTHAHHSGRLYARIVRHETRYGAGYLLAHGARTTPGYLLHEGGSAAYFYKEMRRNGRVSRIAVRA